MSSVLSQMIRALLQEGKLENILGRTDPDLHDDIKKLSAEDPSGKNKYLDWGVKQLQKAEDEVEEIIEILGFFHKDVQRLQKKDINQYRSLGDLRVEIEKLGSSKGAQKRQVKKDTSSIYEDDRFKVVKPTTGESSCTYGKGTTWCIAASRSGNMFNSYSKRNIWFYFIIDKAVTDFRNEPKGKISFPIKADGEIYQQSGVMVDAANRSITAAEVQTLMGDSYAPFLSVAQKDAKSSGNTKQWEMQSVEEKMREQLRTLQATVDQELIRAAWQEYQDETLFGRAAVKSLAKNPNVSTDILRVIAQRQPDLRDDVLVNPNAPKELTQEILGNPINYAGQGNYRATQLIDNTLDHLDDTERQALFALILEKNPDLSNSDFKRLTDHAKAVSDLRVLLNHADNNTKKYHIKHHPVAVQYKKDKAARQGA